MKKYVLYGTGLEGEKLIYRYNDITDEITYCIDRFHRGEFHGIPIVTLEEAEDLNKYMVLVAAIWPTYQKIKRILEERGLEEYKNFIWAQELGKKLVIINANCYGSGVAEYLNECPEFVEQFCIHPIPFIHVNQEKEIACSLLQRADVYIHQDIRPDNGVGYKLSDEYIAGFLKKDCLNITIPNFVGMVGWLFPTQEELGRYVPYKGGAINFFYKDRAIDEAWRELGTAPLQQYVSFYDNYVIEDEELKNEENKFWKKLSEREENWSIKVADFIQNNFRIVPCFVDCSHPSHYLMEEICHQIANRLNIVGKKSNTKHEMGFPSPVLKCVKDYYGINYTVPDYKLTPRFLNSSAEIDLAEYIKEYIWWFYGVML